jgi:hypothetical protein
LIARGDRRSAGVTILPCGYREPVEKHWFAYLKGQGTLETAIDNIVAAIPR